MILNECDVTHSPPSVYHSDNDHWLLHWRRHLTSVVSPSLASIAIAEYSSHVREIYISVEQKASIEGYSCGSKRSSDDVIR
jgi:hypothetical protein